MNLEDLKSVHPQFYSMAAVAHSDIQNTHKFPPPQLVNDALRDPLGIPQRVNGFKIQRHTVSPDHMRVQFTYDATALHIAFNTNTYPRELTYIAASHRVHRVKWSHNHLSYESSSTWPGITTTTHFDRDTKPTSRLISTHHHDIFTNGQVLGIRRIPGRKGTAQYDLHHLPPHSEWLTEIGEESPQIIWALVSRLKQLHAIQHRPTPPLTITANPLDTSPSRVTSITIGDNTFPPTYPPLANPIGWHRGHLNWTILFRNGSINLSTSNGIPTGGSAQFHP